MPKIHLIANWKAHPGTVSEARRLALDACDAITRSRSIELVLAVPHPFLSAVAEVLGKKRGIVLAAQDVSAYEEGAHTGSVTASMLKSIGVQEVIVGHSERRSNGLTDEGVSARVHKLLKRGLTVVICVGEKARDMYGNYLKAIESQVLAALKNAPKSAARKLVIAYEPLWAIGEDAISSDTPEGFREVAIYIRKVLSAQFGPTAAVKIPVLYGGSVNSKNAEQFLREGHASGLLIGRASLKSKDFNDIIAGAERVGKERV